MILGASFLLALGLIAPGFCQALAPGALLYRTTGDGKMFGFSDDPLVEIQNDIIRGINPGHTAIYIGRENGVDYIVEALASGVVKSPASEFIDKENNEIYLGAKIPRGLSAVRQAKAVAIARNLAERGLDYDFDFSKQKGPGSGEWTCVGVTEKVYESADINNPNNLDALEYDPKYYAIDITTDGYDNYSVVNGYGDCFSRDYEFSKIGRRPDLFLPAPEILGYNAGLIKGDERYFFLPYTQFLQETLEDVPTDIEVASYFPDSTRGSTNAVRLGLRWSLINNPISSLKIAVQKVKDKVAAVIGSISGRETAVETLEFAKEVESEEESTQVAAVVNKASGEKKSKQSSKQLDKEATKPEVNVKLDNLAAGLFSGAKVEKNETAGTSGDNKAQTEESEKVAAATVSKATGERKPNGASGYFDLPVAVKQSTSSASVKNNSSTNSSSSSHSSSSGSSSSSNSSSSSSNSSSNNTPAGRATIDQIYATGDNDFIVLYNPGEAAFDLAAAGYRLEKSKTAEDPSLMMRLGNAEDGRYPGGTSIASHGYYLIAKESASAHFLAKAQAIATREEFSWPASGYTIYLGTDAISSSADPDIKEAIGFGSDATYYQGSGPAAAIADGYILDRVAETNNNEQDFSLIKSDDPAIDWSATSSPENSNASSTPLRPLVLFRQVYATGDNDWLEIYNPTDQAIDLAASGYRLEKSKTAEDPSLMMRLGNTEDGFYPGGTVVAPGESYLIVASSSSQYYRSQADAIAIREEFSWGLSGYTIYSADDAISSSTDPDIIEALGFGSDATYYQGSGPAPMIEEGKVLQRVAVNGDNASDFILAPADDPDISSEEEEAGDDEQALGTTESAGIYALSSNASDIFPRYEALVIEDLHNLWHLDECRASSSVDVISSSDWLLPGPWLPGKFGCATEINFFSGPLKANVDSFNANSFSFSFWYRRTLDFPRLNVHFSGSAEEDDFSFQLNEDYIEILGLASPTARYSPGAPFNDDAWHQATLVVNRAEGYWALYLDGAQAIRVDSYKLYGNVDEIEFGGNNGPYAFDEVALWDRALSSEEVSLIFFQGQPFAPYENRSRQRFPILREFWDFSEGRGEVSLGRLASSSFPMSPEDWDNLNLNEAAAIINARHPRNLPLPQALLSEDLSLSFRWRGLDEIFSGRTRVLLKSNEDRIFGGAAGQYPSFFYFDNNSFHLGEGVLPLDSNWHDVAIVYDSYRHALSFYVDGEEKRRQALLWSGNFSKPDTLEVVAENGPAEITDLAVWEGALSPRQVSEIHSSY